MQTTTATGTDTLNSLLRGEMSAIETYRQALEKITDEAAAGVEKLRAIKRDHRDAADELWHHVGSQGEKPAEGSGAWGAFAKAVEGTAKVFGNVAALNALKEGEVHGQRVYQAALDDRDVPAEIKQRLRPFLARQHQHVAMLDELIAAL
jgi:uncharacterized protein (TIGR02284 family)